MRRTKSRAVVAALVVVIIVSAACSGDPGAVPESDDVDEPGANEVQTETETTPAASSEPQKGTSQDDVRVISEECPIVEPSESVSVDAMIWEIPVTALIGAELEECSSGNLSVTSVLLPLAEAQTQIEAELAKDSSDVEIYSTTDGTLALHAQEFIDLSAYIDKYWEHFDLGDIPQPLWDAATVDGRILGVPLFANTLHFFYNSEILAEYDIAPPDNYDELLVACETLREAGFDDPFNTTANSTGGCDRSAMMAGCTGQHPTGGGIPVWHNVSASMSAPASRPCQQQA